MLRYRSREWVTEQIDLNSLPRQRIYQKYSKIKVEATLPTALDTAGLVMSHRMVHAVARQKL